MYTWTDGTELYHHGILGQKWGVRRYQNKDGSLTKAGQNRYGTENHSGKARYNDEKGTFRASNGQKVGAPKTRYQKFVRKAMTSGMLNLSVNSSKKDYERSGLIRDEANALREYNAHQKDLKRGTGTKHLDAAVRKTNLDNAKTEISRKTGKVNKLIFNEKTRDLAAKYVVDNNIPVEKAVKMANKKAIANTAAVLAIYGAITLAELKFNR